MKPTASGDKKNIFIQLQTTTAVVSHAVSGGRGYGPWVCFAAAKQEASMQDDWSGSADKI